MNLKEIDEDLKEIQSRRIATPGVDGVTPSPEGEIYFQFSATNKSIKSPDDVAIADAIAQVEKELQKEKRESSIWYLGLVIAGGLIASKIAQAWFAKNN